MLDWCATNLKVSSGIADAWWIISEMFLLTCILLSLVPMFVHDVPTMPTYGTLSINLRFTEIQNFICFPN
jgi:hypothetical protein